MSVMAISLQYEIQTSGDGIKITEYIIVISFLE
jgi:hypothetical protein